MADVITRFRLETTQYDSKLRDAAKSLAEVSRQAQLGGKSFNNFSKNAIENARSLGTVASGATNLKDKVKDLVGAYNAAANAYNTLTREQQQSDFGKALADSLSQLKSRIDEAKQELYGLGNAMSDVSTKSKGLFGENGLTGMLQVAGGNLISKGAMAIGSELVDTIQQSIELARAGEGIRLAFERLNQPGLLDRLKEATHGTVSEIELMKQAIKFENFKLPLEDLATYLEFAQQKAKDTGDSIDFLVTSIVNGLGRQSKQILDNLGISAAELTRRMNEGADMTKAVADIIREEMEKAGDYVDTAADRAARANAKMTDNMETLGRQATEIAEEWSRVWGEIKIGGMKVLTDVLSPIADSIRDIRDLLSGEYTLKIKADIPNLADGPIPQQSSNSPKWGDVPVVTAPGGYVEVTDTNTGKVIGGRHFDNLQDANSINDWRKSLFKTTTSTTPKTTKNVADDIQKQFDMAMLKAASMSESFKAPDLSGPSDAWKAYTDAIKQESDDAATSVKDLTDAFGKLNKAEGVTPTKDLSKDAKNAADSFRQASSAISMVSGALASIDDPAAKIMGTIGQAIATIAMAYSEALAKDKTNKSNIWYFIATAAAMVTSMATTISAIHSATGYAEGGVVQGNTYSGDQVPAMLNAGEVVLTKAMTNNLASSIQEIERGGGSYKPSYISGEQIWLVLNHYTKRSGKGEIATWR